jgi:polysaccharide pyruvyl transferase WcaK-like protein
MNIEIYGAKFINKGAELMLNTVITKVSERYPNAKFVLSCSSKKEWKQLSNKGFAKKLTYRKHVLDLGDLGRFIPKGIRKKYNIVLNNELDYVFEASGFAYGDQWTYRMAYAIDKKIKKWIRNNTKVIIMPQAFGPFTKDQNAKYTQAFLNKADLVYVRDKASLGFVENLKLNKQVKLKPDFTILLKGEEDNKYQQYKNAVCIIPNNKVISTSSDPEIENKYIQFFTTVINYYKNKNKQVFILNHEGQKDYDLALKLTEQNSDTPIVWEKNPLKIKRIIGEADTVIGSRFHGLVSALSQTIPCYAIGWSHKYEMLFEDFGFKEGVLDVEMDTTQIINKLDNIENSITRKQIIENIKESGDRLKKESENMWDEIYNLIDNG